MDPVKYDGMNDMMEVFAVLERNPEIGFLYLSPAVPRNSVEYYYYNIMYVINILQDFYLLSNLISISACN